MNLYVSNLGEQITDESLRAIFATYGQVSSSKIIRHQNSTLPGGFAFVNMPDDADAQKAMEKINGTVINGRNVSVKQARPVTGPERSFTGRVKNW